MERRQPHYHLNTKAWGLGRGTYELRIDLGDGEVRTVRISLR